MRTYYLRMPYFKGENVKRLQRALRSNSFSAKGRSAGVTFDPGPIDGVFGPKTATACKRAKWWLGYPRRNVVRSGGQQLYDLLTKKRKLKRAQVERRKKRIAARLAKTTLAKRTYQKAKAEIGAPGSVESPKDVNKYTKWWFGGWGYPIGNCSIFASWCCAMAGSKHFYPCKMSKSGRVLAEGFSDYSEEMLVAARAGRHGLRVISSPVKGCLVVWNWDGGGTDHTSVFESRGGGQVTTIDANCPDRVARRTRSESLVTAYILQTA